jgi:hypothetical protein
MRKILLTVILMNATACFADKVTWNYETLSGAKQVVELSKNGRVSITSEDVTINEVECSDKGRFALCLETLRMSLVVPKLNELDKSWKFKESEFRLVRRLNKFKILGAEFKDVLFIQARKRVYKDKHRASSVDIFHEFVFTYENGLLAYRETNEGFSGGEFFVSDKSCNIGGACLAEER